MAAIFRKLWEGYHFLFEEIPDSRTKSWFLVAKPYQGLLILGLYLMFVFKWGPMWMKKRPGFNLERVLIVYNAAQVVLCAILVWMAVWLAWGWKYKWVCEPVDYSDTEHAMNVAKTVYLYYMVKIIDLMDSVFFVLRKKSNQLSFLHVYHHTGMVLLSWAAITYFPGGHGTLVGVVNSFVHVIMYMYYLLSVTYPSIKQSLIKKHITQLQILQFSIFVVHMATLIFIPNCAYPRWIAAVFLPQNFFMLVLFVDFYIKEYIRKPKLQQKQREVIVAVKKNGYKNGSVLENYIIHDSNFSNKFSRDKEL